MNDWMDRVNKLGRTEVNRTTHFRSSSYTASIPFFSSHPQGHDARRSGADNPIEFELRYSASLRSPSPASYIQLCIWPILILRRSKRAPTDRLKALIAVFSFARLKSAT
ncbi:hypothetical protein PCANC_27600 [Puccinia coronata f. sp. avenae]|uniref:Uncharacterized protein n=1 Tax=Puccinia coronata f. sp. avenae TaxID=200324 RepID=A0A2N5TLE4_9BASI|nr:hypothetical protein PCASD_26885 [Puccinia coronata f. sp. avenae]PLW09328.1 hypothetical protein PCANC_27081 [Puccinia coronata f. sp. avenae]PLW26320.1 hypothetical protein PCANC_27600 [Puccinia coronata f. sp. avenae]